MARLSLVRFGLERGKARLMQPDKKRTKNVKGNS